MLDSEEIKKIIPHRYPFLLVDRVVELDPGVRIVGMKNVTVNEHFFQGHWPHRAVMPAVLILEALAQTAGLMLLSQDELRGKNAYFAGINKARFRRQVSPGDTLTMTCTMGRVRSGFGLCEARAEVDGQLVADGELMFALVDESAEADL